MNRNHFYYGYPNYIHNISIIEDFFIWVGSASFYENLKLLYFHKIIDIKEEISNSNLSLFELPLLFGDAIDDHS